MRSIAAYVTLVGAAALAATAAARGAETVLEAADFSGAALPPDWHFAGSPWRMDGGAVSPRVTGERSILYYRHGATGRSDLDRKSIEARIEVVSPGAIFGLCTQGTYGTVAEVDLAAGMLRLYQNWGGGPLPKVLKTAPLGFALGTGKDCDLTLTRTLAPNGGAVEHEIILTLKEAESGRTAQVGAFFTGGTAGWPGHMWGSPGVMVRRGQIRVKRVLYSTPFPAAPLLWIGGDSYVEGDSIAAAKDRRFAQLAAAALTDQVVITGGGGETSGQLLDRLAMDLAPFRPRYCLVLIGANDRSFAVWKPNVAAILARVRAQGAKPLLGTLAPRADRQGFVNQANAWILASHETLVDFAAALTLDGDRRTWNPALALGDGVHPNLAGHAAMLKQLRRDAPFLFSGG